MDDFKEEETIIGYVDTDSGGVLIADMIWDIPHSTQKRVALDLDLGNVRIPVKAVLRDGKRQLILEIDDTIDLLQTEEVVDVTEQKEKEGKE